MKFTTATQGRIFVVRLEDGEIVHETLEKFAAEQNIQAASLIILGGADKGSQVVSGPEAGRTLPIVPIVNQLYDVHEINGTGTIFPNSEGKPKLHLHLSCGRGAQSITGCSQKGIKVWFVMEVVIYELMNCTAKREFEKENGFKLLNPK